MTESPQNTTGPAAAAQPQQSKPYWLYRFAAWVVIVAGIVFIASTIFFTGMMASDGGHHGHHCHHGHHQGQGMWHKGHHHRGHGPVTPGDAGNAPGELPPSVAPSVAPPGR
ncbi:MAG TPA: hypothetical protein VFR17_04680 [Mycobacterium sp.]|nr:hypothetical protein [Mycobacterium sp.]